MIIVLYMVSSFSDFCYRLIRYRDWFKDPRKAWGGSFQFLTCPLDFCS